MLTYTLKKTPGHPLYEQLYQSIRDDIAAGRLPAGSRLPSKRVLAAHLGVSVVTVESAYAQLLAEGYAEARPRSGVYVCAIGSSVPVQPPHMPSLPQPTAPEPLFDLSGGTGEDVPFPASVWVRTMREVIADKRLMQPVDFAGARSCARLLRPIWSRRAACASRGADLHRRGHGVPLWPHRAAAWAQAALRRRGSPATARSPASTRRTM